MLLDTVKRIVYKIFEKEGVLRGEWHLGKVKTVISTKMLEVYLDGSETAIKIPCNPDVTFNVNDEVFVIFINKKTSDKFVLCRRAV